MSAALVCWVEVTVATVALRLEARIPQLVYSISMKYSEGVFRRSSLHSAIGNLIRCSSVKLERALQKALACIGRSWLLLGQPPDRAKCSPRCAVRGTSDPRSRS